MSILLHPGHGILVIPITPDEIGKPDGGIEKTAINGLRSNGGRDNFPVSRELAAPGASPVHIAGSEATLRGSLA